MHRLTQTEIEKLAARKAEIEYELPTRLAPIFGGILLIGAFISPITFWQKLVMIIAAIFAFSQKSTIKNIDHEMEERRQQMEYEMSPEYKQSLPPAVWPEDDAVPSQNEAPELDAELDTQTAAMKMLGR